MANAQLEEYKKLPKPKLKVQGFKTGKSHVRTSDFYCENDNQDFFLFFLVNDKN